MKLLERTGREVETRLTAAAEVYEYQMCCYFQNTSTAERTNSNSTGPLWTPPIRSETHTDTDTSWTGRYDKRR